MHITITVVECRGLHLKEKQNVFVQFHRAGSEDKTKTKTASGLQPTFLESYSKNWKCNPNMISLEFEIYKHKFLSNDLLGRAVLDLQNYTFVTKKPKIIILPVQLVKQKAKSTLTDQPSIVIQITPEDFGYHPSPYVWTWSYEQQEPTLIMDLADVVQVSCSETATYFVTEKGSLYKLAIGEHVPIKIETLTPVLKVAAGFDHVLFFSKDKTVQSFGENNYGQLGLDDFTSRSIASTVQLAPGLSDAESVFAGRNVSFFVAANGDAYACGDNSKNQLGLRNNELIARPKLLDIKNISCLRTFKDFTMAISHDSLYFTGICNGFVSNTWLHVLTGTRFMSVAGWSDIYALSREGKVFKCDLEEDKAEIVEELSTKNITEIVSGFNHLIAMEENGDVTYIQEGLGDKLKFLESNKALSIAASGTQSIVVTRDL